MVLKNELKKIFELQKEAKRTFLVIVLRVMYRS